VALDRDFDEFHTWTDAATIYHFDEHWRYDGDYGLRGVLTGEHWTLLYLRPSVRYQARPWLSLHGGLALFYNFFDTIDLPELRPHLGLRVLYWLPRRFEVSNYFRLEYRAFYLKEYQKWDPIWRFRWQLQVTSPRFPIGGAKHFFALASIEPFWDIDNAEYDFFGDRFRFNFGIGKLVTSSLRVELNYVFHQVRLADEGGQLDADDHVVRLRFFYSFN
jgi:hypothetical protein